MENPYFESGICHLSHDVHPCRGLLSFQAWCGFTTGAVVTVKQTEPCLFPDTRQRKTRLRLVIMSMSRASSLAGSEQTRRTALHEACLSGANSQAVAFLLQRGADPCRRVRVKRHGPFQDSWARVKGNQYLTPADMAIIKEHSELATLISEWQRQQTHQDSTPSGPEHAAPAAVLSPAVLSDFGAYDK